MGDQDVVGRLRRLVLDLPLVTERVSHGSASWFVEEAPMFASLDDHHHGADHLAVWAAAPEGVQERLVRESGQVYFVPPYVGTRGWVGMRLVDATDWTAVEDLMADAWDVVARPAQRRRAEASG